MPFTENQDMIQALAAKRSDQPFHIWVLPGRARRWLNSDLASATSGVSQIGNVRFRSEADICTAPVHVRITRESGHVRRTSLCPLWANSGRVIQANLGNSCVALPRSIEG